ncbi:succinate--CoA ligase [GDP-forming] subunit beta, mitochondrial-like [Montipora capricornis]|uniref:succinate--CoA ligase [GDP-forming] subunit beta, mitochondrial-like n=1 Tax=Montipora capricornis TaxID=246305 RepID=UPI0035F102CA
MATISRTRNLSSICRKCAGLSGKFRLRSPQTSAVAVIQTRWLNLQEYQSKTLMLDNGLHVQRFKVTDNAKDAVQIAKELDAKEFVVKAQILAGGRGKGSFSSGLKSGVHVTQDVNKVGELIEKMVGYNLTTPQTLPDGVLVKKVMVAESYDIARETYLAILMDRIFQGPVIVASPKGGVDIEEVAKDTPEHIHKVAVDIFKGIQHEDALYLAEKLEFKGPLLEEAAEQIKLLYKLFLKVDATQVEINPFGETPDGKVVCFDAKFNFDDSAKFRQQEVFAMDDQSESDPREVEAGKYALNYISLDGNIACLVNGAGLAMATMDIIKLHGGAPANFLDLGGGVQEEGVFQAFNIVVKDPRVKSILVNIFGGIVDCSIIANGITSAYERLNVKVPVIVRLEGRNVERAKHILTESGMPLFLADDMDDAARKAVISLTG